jgi:hypothetical protein
MGKCALTNANMQITFLLNITEFWESQNVGLMAEVFIPRVVTCRVAK